MALQRACRLPGCPHPAVRRGRCAQHGRQHESTRFGSSTSRGYGSRWQRFVEQFKNELVKVGIIPACGASLPGGPAPTDSRCRADGWLLNAYDLHLDHTPPLQPEERANWQIVCDPLRVIFLCERCHGAKTRREQQAGGIRKSAEGKPARQPASSTHMAPTNEV
jgi:5-methylcytosine-specific restriction endonuclease McrA